MRTDTSRVHRSTSPDGTEIAGRVQGNGPPLVLVHGAMACGESEWSTLLPHLVDHFTCHTPSTRCRGLSGPSDDLRRPGLADDVTAYIDSIGGPVGVFGLSYGGLLSLMAVQQTDAVRALALYEPGLIHLLSDDELGALMVSIGEVDALLRSATPADAARRFIREVTNDDEFAAGDELGVYEQLGPNAEVELAQIAQVQTDEDDPGAEPTSPEALGRIDVPVLVLQGTRSVPERWFANAVEHVVAHVPGARRREITGAGHLGPIFEPAAVAAELVAFFEPLLTDD